MAQRVTRISGCGFQSYRLIEALLRDFRFDLEWNREVTMIEAYFLSYRALVILAFEEGVLDPDRSRSAESDAAEQILPGSPP